jgi:hypothetical protein
MNDLSGLRDAARAMRSHVAFEGYKFVRCNGETGKWLTGNKAKAVEIGGRKFIADPRNALVTWLRFDADGKPQYAGAGRLIDKHEPPARETLGDLNKSRWKNGVDPWRLTLMLALTDPATLERYIYSTDSGGGRDALGVLLDSYCDHNAAAADEMAEQVPLVELASDSYVNSFGKRIHTPQLDILEWVDPPDALLLKRLKPPPSPLPAGSPALKLVPALPVAKNGGGEMDDEIPF